MLNFNRFKIFSIVIFGGLVPFDSAGFQADTLTRSSPANNPRYEARELMRVRKNAEALDVLEKYGNQLEKKLKKEQDSLVNTIETSFSEEQASRISEIAEKEQRVEELKSGNAGVKEENRIMTTNTMFFFGILIGIIVIILFNRFKALIDAKKQLIHSENLLEGIRKEVLKLTESQDDKQKYTKIFSEFRSDLELSKPLLATISADKQNPFSKQAVQLQNNTTLAVDLLSDAAVEPDVFSETDLNKLIEEVLVQSYHTMQSRFEGFNCAIDKDLEKILPKIEVIKEDIRFVLFNLITNAFESVQEKTKNAPKGYEPRIIISTRKLPRFVQVRIKDNGIGINDNNKERVFVPFYSTKPGNRNPGLGLSESRQIINVKHKGELYIESDISETTDFIIRFPTLTIM